MNKNKIIEEFDKRFNRIMHWHRGECVILGANGEIPVHQKEDGTFTGNQFDAVKSFLLSIPTSILMELREDVIKEIGKNYDAKCKYSAPKTAESNNYDCTDIHIGRSEALSDILALIDKKINELK